MDISLYGLLEWVLPKNLEVSGVLAQNVSNILILLYAVSYILNRKAVFITAFLLVEVMGMLSPVDYIVGCSMDCESYEGYYLMYSVGYVFCYWVVFNQTKSIKICSGYVILVLFELTVSYEEWTRLSSETFFYAYYEYIIMAIHIYIISTITKRRSVNRIVRSIIDYISHKRRTSYSLSFFWYTLQQSNLKNSKQCHSHQKKQYR